MTAVLSRPRSTLRIVGQVLRNPTLRRVELAFLSFNTVEYGSWVAILLYAYSATGPASVGLVALAQLLPAAVVAPFGGTLGDRFRRERVLLAAYSLFATWTLLIAAGMLLAWPVAVVYLAAIAASMTLTLVRPAHNALLPGLAHDPSELTAANAVTSIAESSGLLLGPLAAAAILTVAEPGAVLALLALVAATAAILVLGLRPHAHAGAPHVSDEAYDAALQAGEEPHAEARGPAILGGFRALAQHPDARLVVAILSSRMLLIGACDVLFVLIAIEQFGTGESGAAILSAAIGAGGILGGMAAFALIGRQRLAPVLLASGLAWGVLFVLFGAIAPAVLAPVLLVACGIALTLMDVAGRTALQRAVHDEVLARVFGILEGLMTVCLAIGSILLPVTVGLLGIPAAAAAFALVIPLVVLLASPGLRGIDRRANVPVRAIALLRRLPLFAGLAPPTLESLARSGVWQSVPPSTVVIREGDPGERFFVLETGSLDVSRGGEFVRTLSAPGDGFGEIALLRNVPRTATVTATTDSQLLGIGRTEFLAAVTGQPVVRATAGRIVDAYLDRDRGHPGADPDATAPPESARG
jgi:MFS family permease